MHWSTRLAGLAVVLGSVAVGCGGADPSASATGTAEVTAAASRPVSIRADFTGGDEDGWAAMVRDIPVAIAEAHESRRESGLPLGPTATETRSTAWPPQTGRSG